MRATPWARTGVEPRAGLRVQAGFQARAPAEGGPQPRGRRRPGLGAGPADAGSSPRGRAVPWPERQSRSTNAATPRRQAASQPRSRPGPSNTQPGSESGQQSGPEDSPADGRRGRQRHGSEGSRSEQHGGTSAADSSPAGVACIRPRPAGQAATQPRKQADPRSAARHAPARTTRPSPTRRPKGQTVARSKRPNPGGRQQPRRHGLYPAATGGVGRRSSGDSPVQAMRSSPVPAEGSRCGGQAARHRPLCDEGVGVRRWGGGRWEVSRSSSP